jgi:hypothetical protein
MVIGGASWVMRRTRRFSRSSRGTAGVGVCRAFITVMLVFLRVCTRTARMMVVYTRLFGTDQQPKVPVALQVLEAA